MITVNFNKIEVNTNTALGNHLFQYALCRLIAEKNGYNFYIPDENYIVKCFKDVYLGVKDGDIKYTYLDNPQQTYDQNIFNIPDFTNLQGHFQTEKYFEGNEEKIKSWLVIESSSEVDLILNKYPTDEYCYLHIRGGDYITNKTELNKDYYLRAMDTVRTKKLDIKFLIITDDVSFSSSLFPEIDVLSNSVVLDFKCLYFSKYFIMSNSSFSWWCAWLTDKVISVAPNNWLNFNQPWLGTHPIDVKSKKFTFI
jgi:hypothetical protein